ncbi:MAG: hypothetical protein ABJL67_12800 [Sulfitobacter sp.]
MSNVIAFQPKTTFTKMPTLEALMGAVTTQRRPADDVYWLKENAELLSVLHATKEPVTSVLLEGYDTFYRGIEEKLRFYPQYYRFFLSLCLDLEDLGFDGCKGEALCNWAATTGLAEAELSDLQRAEARRLLARRRAAEPVSQGDLGDRLRQFAERPKTFALPNKKAGYELTHIVFYLSEYGQRDPELGPEALRSLEYTGLVAYLDQNHDLLAEICTALRYAGAEPSPIWSQAVAHAHNSLAPVPASEMALAQDAFHAYLVTGWAQRVAQAPAFDVEWPQGATRFARRLPVVSALRPLSECLFDLGGTRSGDWSGMRGRVVPYLDTDARVILQQAEASSPEFGAFFEEFARVAGAQGLTSV